MKKVLLYLLISAMYINFAQAQEFTLNADLRPRFEYRHGYGTLFPDNAKPAAFVTQRSRLNMAFSDEKLSLYFSFQDVSTWGDEQTLSATDHNNSLTLFQAWAKYTFAEHWAFKLGRQTISYDNQRILGEVDWAMQGRFHDALILLYAKDGFKLDLAFAYNQEKQNSLGTDYTITGAFSYKTMQLAHLTKTWDQTSLSFLFMNNGFQKYTANSTPKTDGVYYRQTTGAYMTFPFSGLTINASAYLQTGMATATSALNAYQYMLEANYELGKTSLTIGFESLSGTDQFGAEKNNSFFPMYGTNHKFNGFMDYFYVGNHVNDVGLNDAYGKIIVATGEKSSLALDTHLYFAHAEMANNLSQNLGTELDLVYKNSLGKYVNLSVGYSHLFATESLSAVKASKSPSNTNNWAWVQLTINPTLLSYTFKEK